MKVFQKSIVSCKSFSFTNRSNFFADSMAISTKFWSGLYQGLSKINQHLQKSLPSPLQSFRLKNRIPYHSRRSYKNNITIWKYHSLCGWFCQSASLFRRSESRLGCDLLGSLEALLSPVLMEGIRRTKKVDGQNKI